MNSTLSDIDRLQTDDLQGLHALYPLEEPPSPTPQPTLSPTPSPSPVPSPSPTATPIPAPFCLGDCNLNGTVTVDEVLVMINMALGTLAVQPCADGNQNQQVTVDEILRALTNALRGCGQ